MNKKEYLQKLSLSLNHLPQVEKEDTLEYVQEYLEFFGFFPLHESGWVFYAGSVFSRDMMKKRS